MFFLYLSEAFSGGGVNGGTRRRYREGIGERREGKFQFGYKIKKFNFKNVP